LMKSRGCLLPTAVAAMRRLHVQQGSRPSSFVATVSRPAEGFGPASLTRVKRAVPVSSRADLKHRVERGALGRRDRECPGCLDVDALRGSFAGTGCRPRTASNSIC